MKRLLVSLLTSTFLSTAAIHAHAATQTGPTANFNSDALFSADNIQYEQDTEIVTAYGNVEVVQDGRILKADKVIYNVREDKVMAEGNIALLELTGEVLFADSLELENELKTGAIRDIRILFTDNSRLAANSAVRVDDNSTVMNKAVFSTCRLCETDKNADPLWQVKADQVVHDKQDKTITYKNATLEFFGVPLAYTPYFSHPDPTVDRSSGFLAPSVFNSSALGYGLTAPYYWAISDDKDLTFSPTITSDEGVHLAAEYRQAVSSGSFTLDGSLTYVDERDASSVKTGEEEFQGHLRGLGKFDLTDTWSWGFDFFTTSTDTYLDKYDISNLDTLTSTAYLQGLRGRNFSNLSTYAFQGLKNEDVTGETPFVPAWWEYSYVGEPDKYGARFNADVDVLTLFRSDGQDTQRLSATGGWHLPYTSPSGQVITLDTSLRGDLYYATDQLEDPFDPNSDTETKFSGRVIPSVSLKWKYPFVRHSGSVRQLIEPIVEAVWSEGLGDDDNPNEDSLSFEFDDTNLFGSNRYAGLDQVEEGARLNYGMNFAFYGASGGHSSLLVGQSIHADSDTGFGEGTGLEEQLSDYVARLQIQPVNWLKFSQRVRIDQDNLTLARNEIDMFLGTERTWLNVGYLNLNDDLSAVGIENREEIFAEGRFQFAKFWSTYGGYRRDLDNDGSSIETKFGLEYLDECFGFAVEAKRDFTRDRDVEPNTSISFKFRLLPFN